MTNSLKKLSTLAASLFFIFSMAACATVEGVGEDIETAGEKIQDAAD